MMKNYAKLSGSFFWGLILAVLLTAIVPATVNAGHSGGWYWKAVWVPLTDDDNPDQVMADIESYHQEWHSSSNCGSDGILFPETILRIYNYKPESNRGYKDVGIKLGALVGQKDVLHAKFHKGVCYFLEGVFAPCVSLQTIEIAEDDDKFLPPPAEYPQVFFSTGKVLYSAGKILYKKREDGNVLFWGSCKLLNFEVPERTFRIANFAFANCKEMEWVRLPESLDSIGTEAFKSEKLSKIYCDAVELGIYISTEKKD